MLNPLGDSSVWYDYSLLVLFMLPPLHASYCSGLWVACSRLIRPSYPDPAAFFLEDD